MATPATLLEVCSNILRKADLKGHFLPTNFRKVQTKIARTGVVRRTAILLLILLLVFGFSVAILLLKQPGSTPVVFVGVDIGYGDEAEATKIIDKVSGCVNLVILGSLKVTSDTEKLTRVCDYMCKKGLYFIVYVGFGHESTMPPVGPDQEFFITAEERWGEKLLGAYLFDEPGGKQLDSPDRIIGVADNYSDAASSYVHHVSTFVGNVTAFYEPANIALYTSDYALIWYDYLIGYDIVFGEFVENQTRQLAVGLSRGAAKTLEKDWGVIITYSEQKPPYIEEPELLYEDMVTAYQNGAQYIVVFNSPPVDTPPTTEYGILTPYHFEAMKKFWNYLGTAPRGTQYSANTAYVLPRDYGFGFRGTNDTIWGLWQADNLSSLIWNDANRLITEHGRDLDIVYETEISDESIALPYTKLFFWNGTRIEQ